MHLDAVRVDDSRVLSQRNLHDTLLVATMVIRVVAFVIKHLSKLNEDVLFLARERARQVVFYEVILAHHLSSFLLHKTNIASEAGYLIQREAPRLT